MKKYILLLFLFIYISNFSQIKGKVIKVKDGDTVVVLLEDNTQETLRLAEVDCPEKGQSFGKNAKQFTSSKVFEKEVIFYRTGKDRYRRTIAKIFYKNNKYLSAEIIKAGFGWWYYKASKNSELQKMQDKAKEKRLGLWSDQKAVSPWEFRASKKKKKVL
ncbi:nuclease [Chryseobacterium sp. Leaf405]|uniref:thermonuclease family protein n=1 Tax=Chryseobacterium sp. Leaf405 TaxID=1736367 RepID=UPI0006F9DD30|nr:thermonuclease family protein [Chryseobacterium sp. Leaf405]KQT30901.1 nuclease [Chryseobacterium sp. Leaf405]